MRLSTAADRDDARALATLHAALDAGVTLLDTADAYCLDDTETGHNERLIARALETWSGDRAGITVATKGGLVRPRGRWVPNGRARHLRAAAEASLAALGVDRIDLYQLHAPDPRTPFATSVRALARLVDDGIAAEVGVCNVTLGQLREACDLAPIAAVQVALGPLDDDPLRNGVAEYCAGHGITLLAHSPLGGPRKARKLAKIPALRWVAERRDATPHEVALAWLHDLAPVVVSLPGATRPQTAGSVGRAARLALDDDDRAALDRALPGRLLRVARAQRRPPDDAGGDVVLVMGSPGAGKSTLARSHAAEGYVRLNRDERGGSLADLAQVLDAGLAEGQRRFVLDATWPGRAARNRVIETAWSHGVPVRCTWLTTDLDQAQVNVVRRMLAAHGRLLEPDEIKALSRRDPTALPPRALFDYRAALEPAEAAEGFARIDEVGWDPRPEPRSGRALIVALDGVVRSSVAGHRAPRHPGDVAVDPGWAERLGALADAGWKLLGLAWHPEVASGEMSATDVASVGQRTTELVPGLEIGVCTHAAGPPKCWCRTPFPGLVVEFLDRHGLDPNASLLTGPSRADRTLATRVGVRFVDPPEV